MDRVKSFHVSISGMNDGFLTGTLGSHVAEQLLNKIRREGLMPGMRLPSEQTMAEHFGVSRTVVRDAITLLKSDGLLETRKGSGTFVRHRDTAPASRTDRLTEQSIQSLLNVIEAHSGIETETAALAAVRRRRDPDFARAAAKACMEHAAQRVRQADREFERGKGGELARRLMDEANKE